MPLGMQSRLLLPGSPQAGHQGMATTLTAPRGTGSRSPSAERGGIAANMHGRGEHPRALPNAPHRAVWGPRTRGALRLSCSCPKQHMYPHTPRHKHAHACTNMHTHVHTHEQTSTHTCTPTHAQSRIPMHTHSHAYPCTPRHACTHAHPCTFTHSHTRRHTRTLPAEEAGGRHLTNPSRNSHPQPPFSPHPVLQAQSPTSLAPDTPSDERPCHPSAAT